MNQAVVLSQVQVLKVHLAQVNQVLHQKALAQVNQVQVVLSQAHHQSQAQVRNQVQVLLNQAQVQNQVQANQAVQNHLNQAQVKIYLIISLMFLTQLQVEYTATVEYSDTEI